MDTSLDPLKPIWEYNRLAILSFALGLMTLAFPVISGLYLVTVHGGPGYLQSLFCGIPLTFASLITRIISLLQINRKKQPGAAQVAAKGTWMVVLGIFFGILFIGVFGIMVYLLLAPYLSGGAH